MKKISKICKLLSLAFLIPVPSFVIDVMFVSHNHEYYLYLAESFLKGHLYFMDSPIHLLDTVIHNGHYYWPNPPFPILLLIPFYLIGNFVGVRVSQGFVQFILVVLLFLLLVKIFSAHAPKKDAMYWAYGFMFSTCFIGVAAVSWSWYFAQVITVFFIFLAYYLYKKGWSLFYVGLLYGLIVLTRFTAAVGIVFYVFLLLYENGAVVRVTKALIKKLFLLFVPIAVCLGVLIFYNYARYGTWRELGYAQDTLHPVMQDMGGHGVFSLWHVPGNLYYFLVSSPLPVFADGLKVLAPPYIMASSMGLSIFFTSPIILYLFTFSYKRKEILTYLFTSLLILIPLLLYFAFGGHQFGYRYSLDFLPYLYILLVSKYHEKKEELGAGTKTLLLFTSVLNLYLLLSVFFTT